MKSFVGRLAIVALLIVLLLAAIQGVFYWQVRRQLTTRIGKLQQQKLPIGISQLGHPASLKNGAIAELESLEQELGRLDKVMLAIPATQEGQDDIAAQNLAFGEFVLRHPDLIARIREASRLAPVSRADPTLNPSLFLSSLLEHSVPFRRAARALTYDAQLNLAKGSTDQAAGDAMAILRWGEHASQQPTLVNLLVSVAIDSAGMSIAAQCIAKDDLSNQVRVELLNEVSNLDFSDIWTRGLISERALGISMYQENLGAAAHLKSMVADQCHYLDLLEEYVQTGQEPFGMGSLPAVPATTLSASVEPSLLAGLTSLRRLQSQQHAVLILAAWIDAGRANDPSIEALQLDSSFSVDPFDGGRMRMRIDRGAVTLYSVGSNRVDDGGSLTDRLDEGILVAIERSAADLPDGSE